MGMAGISSFLSTLSDFDNSSIVKTLAMELCEQRDEESVKSFIKSMIDYVPIVPEKGKSYDYTKIALVSGVRGY